MMRTRVKALLERGLVATGFPRVWSRTNRSAGLVLAYHNIIPTGAVPGGDHSLHLAQSAFAKQLDLLQRYTDVVPLDQLLDGKTEPGRPRIAITFDDAYQGAMTAGLLELRRRSLPATIFVAPAFVGGRSFWWDDLAASAGLSVALRTQALEACAGRDPVIRKWAESVGLPATRGPAHALAATEAEIATALDYPLLSLASHTWSHPNLTQLDAGDLVREMTDPRQWLEARYQGRVLPFISYPYGLNNAEVQQAALAAGYGAAFAVSGGWLPQTIGARFRLPRMNVPAGISPYGFQIRLAGLLCD